jgi:hypothetical protein
MTPKEKHEFRQRLKQEVVLLVCKRIKTPSKRNLMIKQLFKIIDE